MELIHSFPSLNTESMQALEKTLSDKFDYPALPEDYKQFLLENNGGYVKPGYGNGSEDPTQEVVFETPLHWVKDNNRPVTPSLIAFFVVWLPQLMNKDEVTDWDIYELLASNEHSKFDFDVLPNRMISIAKCSHPEAADMLCLGLDDSDFGVVYYTYDKWYYPGKFHGDYYDKATQHILDKYQLESEQDIDEDTEQGKKAIFELERVPFVKVADSFGDFLNKCRIQAF